MIDGVMSEEGVLMGYFLKENLNRLNVREIRYAYFENSGTGECYWIMAMGMNVKFLINLMTLSASL